MHQTTQQKRKFNKIEAKVQARQRQQGQRDNNIKKAHDAREGES